MHQGSMHIGSGEWRRLVKEGAAALGVRLDEGQLRLLALHATELLRWNRRVNLTRISAPVEVAVKHFLDSLAAAPLIGDGPTVLDMGSGGGFPGLPIKVALPHVHVTLVDSVRKKVSFLKHVIRQGGLQGVEALQARIEDLACDAAHRECYQVVISRALAPLDQLARLAVPLLAPGGSIIALKAGQAAAEICAVEKQQRRRTGGLPLRVVSVREVTLPVLNLERRGVVLQKACRG